MNKVLFALGCALVFAGSVSGCATARKACSKVAEADDAYAQAMKYLREAGLLAACDAGVVSACKAKDAVLAGQEKIYQAYTVCYEDSP